MVHEVLVTELAFIFSEVVDAVPSFAIAKQRKTAIMRVCKSALLVPK
jgi:hypothetical protein